MEFAFQKLDVGQLAVGFADTVISATENLQASRQHYRLKPALERRVGNAIHELSLIRRELLMQKMESISGVQN